VHGRLAKIVIFCQQGRPKWALSKNKKY
jgi:hypothetical protein